MLNFLSLNQGSPEWLAFRRTKIGASDIASITGKDPYRTPLMIYDEKTLGTQKAVNLDMQRGQTLEPVVRDALNERYEFKYEPKVVENSQFDFAFASLDGWNENREHKILEVKSPRILPDRIPDHHMLQMQWQMMVCNVATVFYVCFDGSESRHFIAERDDKVIDELKSWGRRFFARLVEFDPPEPTDRDLIEINDPESIWTAKNLHALQQEIKKLEIEEKKLKTSLIERCSGRSSLIDGLRFVRSMRKGNVEYGKIPELQNVNLEPFRKASSEVWTLRRPS
jgi:putative phage-type endonuclease